MPDYDDILRRALADPNLNSDQRDDIQRRIRAKIESVATPMADIAVPTMPGYSPSGMNVKTPYGSVTYNPIEIPTVEQENESAAKRLEGFLGGYTIPTLVNKTDSGGVPIQALRPYTPADLRLGQYENGVQRFDGILGIPSGASLQMPESDRREALGLLEISRGNVPAEVAQANADEITAQYLPMAQAYFAQQGEAQNVSAVGRSAPLYRSGDIPTIPTDAQLQEEMASYLEEPGAPDYSKQATPTPVTEQVFRDFYNQAGRDKIKARKLLEEAGYYVPQ